MIETIYLKAWADEKLKNNLLKNPKKILGKLFGTKFACDNEIVVSHQSNPDCNYFNISIIQNFGDIEFNKSLN